MEDKRAIVLYLHVHQPFRVRHYSALEIAHRHDYFDAPDGARENNADIIRKVAEKSYLPTNERLLRMLEQHPEYSQRQLSSALGISLGKTHYLLPAGDADPQADRSSRPSALRSTGAAVTMGRRAAERRWIEARWREDTLLLAWA